MWSFQTFKEENKYQLDWNLIKTLAKDITIGKQNPKKQISLQKKGYISRFK